jgi:hypothetical protein
MSFEPIFGQQFIFGPELVPWGQEDENLFAFAVGVDQALWYARFDRSLPGRPGGWSHWQSLGGIVTSAPRAARPARSSVDVFATGIESELLHWQFRDGSWVEQPLITVSAPLAVARVGPDYNPLRQYWQSLGGILTSPPYAVSPPIEWSADDQVFVLARGTDQALWARTSVSGVWSNWVSLGHQLASRPCAAISRDLVMAVFAVGTDSAIWYTLTPSVDSAPVSGDWRSLGGTFSSAPCAVTWGAWIFVFATDADGALSYNRWDGDNWNGWRSLGGTLMSAPVASSYYSNDGSIGNAPTVYALGTDSGVWRRSYEGEVDATHTSSIWSEWESLGAPQAGYLLALPAATVQITLSHIADIAALGTDHRIWHWENNPNDSTKGSLQAH